MYEHKIVLEGVNTRPTACLLGLAGTCRVAHHRPLFQRTGDGARSLFLAGLFLAGRQERAGYYVE